MRKEADIKAEGPMDDLIDTRTEQDRARDAKRTARELELASDLASAADLFGDVNVTDPKATLESILKSDPKSKAEFDELSRNVMALIISKHVDNPLFPAFVEGFSKDMCESLTAVQVRKVGSGLSTLGNTKQQEERDKASGKKKVSLV
jgi:translation initiation factor 3 subunit J